MEPLRGSRWKHPRFLAYFLPVTSVRTRAERMIEDNQPGKAGLPSQSKAELEGHLNSQALPVASVEHGWREW